MFIRASKKHSIDTVRLQDIIGVDREGNEVRIEDKIHDNDHPPIDEQVSLKMQTKSLLEAVNKVLHGREKIVIIKRYGLDNSEEMTQREIADELGISRSYVSRIEKKALNKLFKELFE